MSSSELQSHRDVRWLGWTALAVFFIGWAALWGHLNHAPPEWDDSWYLTDSLYMFDALKTGGVEGWLRSYFFHAQDRLRAPLMCALPTPIYLVFGRNAKLAFMVNYLFIILMCWSLHGIARRLWGSRVALLAVFITGTLTQVFFLTTQYMVEYGLAAIVAGTIFCLIQSEDLKRARWVTLLGILCGLGMLQKIVFPVYVAPLILYFLFRWGRSVWRKEIGGPSVAATLAAFLLPLLLIAGPWYYLNLRIVVHHAWESGFSKQEADLYGTGNVFSVGAVRKYLLMVINEGIGAMYLCVAMAGVVVWIVVRGWRRRASLAGGIEGKIVLALWAMPFLIFLFGHNKQVRFITPILPIFAIVLAILFSQIIETIGRWGWALTAALLLGTTGFMVQMFFEPLGSRTVIAWANPSNPRDDMMGLHFLQASVGEARVYESDYWPLLKTLQETIGPASSASDKKYYVMTASDSRHFNLNNLQLAATQAGLPVEVRTSAYYHDAARLCADIRTMDFLVVRVNAEVPDLLYNKFLSSALDEVKEDGLFESIPSSIAFPDQGVLWIYRNRSIGATAAHSTSRQAR